MLSSTRHVHLVRLVIVLMLVMAGCTTAVDDQPMRVGFILVGERDDLGYNQAVWEGADVLARAMPDIEVLRTENVPEDERAVEAMEELIERGATVVLATSFGHRDAALEVARAHPDVVVLHQGATPTVTELDSFGSYFGAHSEASYGAGVAAGHVTTTGRLGFVIAFPIPASYNNVNAFTLGVRSVVPDATVQLEMTDSWCDPDAQRAAARTLVSLGVDVVAQHQDCTTAILEHARDAGIGAVGYHADGSEVAGASWVMGAVWTWGELYIDVVRTVQDGTFAESAYREGFVGTVANGDDPLVLTEAGPSVPADGVAAVDEAMAAFRDGTATVFRGPLADRTGALRVPDGSTLTQDEIDAMDWFVEGVLGGP